MRQICTSLEILRHSHGYCLAVSLVVFFSGTAFAEPGEEPGGDTEMILDEVVVRAASVEGAGVGLKIPLALKDIPQTLSIIDRDRLDQQRLVTLDDVMQSAPGVTVQPGTRLRTAYYSRGFSIDTLSFDGIPTSGWNEAVNTEDMAIYERVELLRGASGLLQGTGNPSGTINLVRKRAGEDFDASAALSGGSWNNWRGELDVGGGLTTSGNVRARGVAVFEDRDYFYDVTHRKKSLLYGTSEWNITPSTVIAATVKWQDLDDDGSLIGGLPRYSDGTALDVSRSFNPGTDWSFRKWENTQAFLELRHEFEGDWQGKIAVSHIDGDSQMRYANLYGGIDRATGRGAFILAGAYGFDNKETDVDAYVTGSVEAFGRRHELLFGANYWDGETSQTSYSLQGLPMTANILEWNPHQIPAPTGRTYSGEQSTTTTQYGGYGVVRLHVLDPLTIIAGGRLSWWETDTERRASVDGPLVPAGQYKVDNQFTPYGGVVWDLTSELSLYGSYTSIFTPQNYRGANGDVIDPMTGDNFEVGLKGAWFDGRLDGALSAFRILQENRAQTDPSVPCLPGTQCVYIAEGKVRTQGVDFEVNGDVTPELRLQAGYTWVDTEYVRDRTATGGPSTNEGQPFSRFTPHHMLKLWAHYHPRYLDERLSIGAGVNAQSSSHVISNGMRMEQGGDAVANVRLGYKITPKIDLSLNVNNLFDKTYFTRLGGVEWNNWYGEPRSVLVTLRARY